MKSLMSEQNKLKKKRVFNRRNETNIIDRVIIILKLLFFPIFLVILISFNALNASNLLFLVVGFLIFFYATEFLFKEKQDIFNVKNKVLSIIIFILFIGSILFSVYYIWFK